MYKKLIMKNHNGCSFIFFSKGGADTDQIVYRHIPEDRHGKKMIQRGKSLSGLPLVDHAGRSEMKIGLQITN